MVFVLGKLFARVIAVIFLSLLRAAPPMKWRLSYQRMVCGVVAKDLQLQMGLKCYPTTLEDLMVVILR